MIEREPPLETILIWVLLLGLKCKFWINEALGRIAILMDTLLLGDSIRMRGKEPYIELCVLVDVAFVYPKELWIKFEGENWSAMEEIVTHFPNKPP